MRGRGVEVYHLLDLLTEASAASGSELFAWVMAPFTRWRTRARSRRCWCRGTPVVFSGVLGVSTGAYLPYCFFNFLSPVLDVLYGFIGFKVPKAPWTPSEQPASGEEQGLEPGEAAWHRRPAPPDYPGRPRCPVWPDPTDVRPARTGT